jgi:hypothetical protein
MLHPPAFAARRQRAGHLQRTFLPLRGRQGDATSVTFRPVGSIYARSSLSIALLCFLLWAPAVVGAEEQITVDKLIEMNKEAVGDYESLEWQRARRTLLEALARGKRSKLESHPIIARTYIHLGAVYVTGFKDHDKGLQSFLRALEIDPKIRVSKAMSNPQIDQVFADAVRQTKTEPAVAKGDAGPATDPPRQAKKKKRRK